MKRLVLATMLAQAPTPAVLATQPDGANSSWFTVLGDPSDPSVTTIEIDPRPVAVKGESRTMLIRLNRSRDRVSTDGVRFRSYVSEVEFDCAGKIARFTSTQFYEKPLWTAPGQKQEYASTRVRPMEFRDIEPNPRDRVVRAACLLGAAGR